MPGFSVDGFDRGVNGHYDVGNALSGYLRDRASAHLSEARERKRGTDTREAFESRRDRVRADVLDAVGGLPDRPPDPAVETTGVLERDGYAVELVVVESLPGFRVTANCYVPDREGPHPGILFLCGHVQAAKADEYNQRACIELALNGFVVLAVDPIAQGERGQYHDPETGEPRFDGTSGGVFAHCYAGQQCFYAGANLARYFVHDARRGLDYLQARDDVDEDRVGAVGTSGGGLQTQYLALLDDRVDAAAPCCSVTTREEWLKTGKRIDAEQCLYGAIDRGIDHDDLVVGMAPRPVFVGAAASDQYFPVEGVHEAHRRLRRVYDRYDATENLELAVVDERHCSVHEVGDPVYEFLCDHLGDDPYESHDDDLAVVEESRLHCTPDGSVVAAYEDERTIAELIREYVRRQFPRDGPGEEDTDPDDGDRPPAAVRERVVERFGLDRDPPDPHPRYVAEAESDGFRIQHVLFRTERDPDAPVTGVLVSDPAAGQSTDSGADPDAAGPPAVVCYEEGTGELPGRSEDVASLVADHGTVLVFDPRGVGAVRNRRIPVPAWVEDYHQVYGTEFKLAYDALLLGTSLFGLRVYDLCRAAEFLRSETGSDRVALVGEGAGAYHAAYAGVVDRTVESVELRDLGPGFREMATARDYPYETRLTVSGVLDCDLPDCLAALADRGVRIRREEN